MESSLTNLEMNAVFQLVQLRGGYSDDFQVFWVNFPRKKGESVGEETEEESKEEESVGDTSLFPETTSDEALPRRRMRLRSIDDIYRRTRPLVKSCGALRKRKM